MKKQILVLISIVYLTNNSYVRSAMGSAVPIDQLQNKSFTSYLNKLSKEELETRIINLNRQINEKRQLATDYITRHEVTRITYNNHFQLRVLGTEIKKLKTQAHTITQILKTRSDLAI